MFWMQEYSKPIFKLNTVTQKSYRFKQNVLRKVNKGALPWDDNAANEILVAAFETF